MTTPIPTGTVADAVRGHWADRFIPAGFRPYARLARLERPIGWWLLLWPCWWSAALAAVAAHQPYPNPWHLLLFLIGAVVMRGAGCTYNDIVDRDIDEKVARTRSRPIPSGQVSVARARLFMVGLALVGFLVLIQFNGFAILLGIASLGVVAVYPFMKRVTHWPQFTLGLAFSWGALMGWAGAFGRLDPPALLLYAGAILWTIGYDTIYAHQDKEDDAVVGVRSTALLFGPRTRPMLALFYGAAVAALAAAVLSAGGGVLSMAGLGLMAAHLAWQVRRIDVDDPDVCLMLFRSNRDAGWLFFLGLCADAALHHL
ncbi:4-hydroxybenzoate octaprenyltransferase [Prosthecomicrobium sp. N25]|uniref:4-hydroxybenzoate octaprenyltransferase n=1 Tax=Prosthecomicrobium sp. N25 TaxID=3129254 RepID=UPI0030770389